MRGGFWSTRALEKESVLREPLEEDSVLREPAEEDSVLREPLEEDSVLRGPLEKESVLREALEEGSVLREPLEEDSVLRGQTRSLRCKRQLSERGLRVKGNSFTVRTHFERSTLSCQGLGELVSIRLQAALVRPGGRAPGAR